MNKFEDYKELASNMEAASDKRTLTFTEMEAIYSMEGGDMPDKEWIKKTRSPDPHNQVKNGARMLSVVDPQFTLPFSDPEQQENADKIQNLMTRAYSGAGVVKGKPLAYTMGLSALLYGEVHLRFRLVNDLIKQSSNPTRRRRLERISLITPILWDVLPPKNCYALTDDTGLIAHNWKTERLVSQVINLSDKARSLLAGRKLTDRVTVNDMVDEDNRAIWIDTMDEPLIFEPLKDGIMPIAYTEVDGSELFDDQTVEKIQPFLYQVFKSKLWERQSLAWTIFFSNFFQMAATTQFVAYLNDPDRQLQINKELPGEVLLLQIGEKFEQAVTQVFTADLMQAFTLTDRKIEESTMYRTATGQSPGENAAYSLAALLNQAGRQALSTAERMCSHVAGVSMTNALLALKNSGGGAVRLSKNGESQEFDLTIIPDNIIAECTFKAKLPQDMRANAQLAQLLTGGPHPIVDYAWVREQLFDLGDSNAVDKRLVAEAVAWARAQATIQAEVQAIMQKINQPPQPPPGQVPPGGPPQQQPVTPQGGPTPEQMDQLRTMIEAQRQAQMQPREGVQSGLPLSAPIPPEQLMGQQGGEEVLPNAPY